MCVDRLEVGLHPACVAACLGNALDFGVVESVPDDREQAKVSIPGFPDPEITHPNIRFQQTKDTQRDMTRPDGMPIKYHKQDNGEFKSVVDTDKHSSKKYWVCKNYCILMRMRTLSLPYAVKQQWVQRYGLLQHNY